MRLPIKLALASLAAAGALVVAPVMSASAATVHHPQHAPAVASHQVAVPMRLTPGTHTVSYKIPEAAGSRPAAAQATSSVQVRVGKNNCGGFNGSVSWGFGYITITGILWDNCDYYTPDTTVYLYLKFTVLGTPYNEDMQSVSGGSANVNTGFDSLGASPGDIYVDTCLQWDNGWGCGPAQHL